MLELLLSLRGQTSEHAGSCTRRQFQPEQPQDANAAILPCEGTFG